MVHGPSEPNVLEFPRGDMRRQQQPPKPKPMPKGCWRCAYLVWGLNSGFQRSMGFEPGSAQHPPTTAFSHVQIPFVPSKHQWLGGAGVPVPLNLQLDLRFAREHPVASRATLRRAGAVASGQWQGSGLRMCVSLKGRSIRSPGP